MLIVRAVDRELDAAALDRLMRHVDRCAGCRYEAATQFDVKRVLASRPEDPLPAGFAEQLSARLTRERFPYSWIDLANWRAWGVGVLSAAAALFVTIVTADVPVLPPAESLDLSAAVIAWDTPAGEITALLVQSDVGDEMLLTALLTGRLEAGAEEPQ